MLLNDGRMVRPLGIHIRRKKMKAIVIPVFSNQQPYLIEVPLNEELKTYYDTIGCRLIDVVMLYSNDNIAIDCIVDDEGVISGGMLNRYWLRSYMNGDSNIPLFGITIITMTDLDTGATIDLDLKKAKDVLIHMYGFTDEELENIHD
jgi:hypothetical protein